MTKKTKWIQAANLKRGALHESVGASPRSRLPDTLLNKIKLAPAGTTITNPTMTGRRKIHVTPIMKKRANFAINVRR